MLFKVNNRESGVETLRMIAMFMVIILHINALDFPTPDSFGDNNIVSFSRLLIQSFCVVAVNVFIIISGWFGIHSSIKGFSKLVFQCLFFSILLELSRALVINDFNSIDWIRAFVPGSNLWFIKSYFLLYLFSPVINKFVDNSSKKEVLCLIIAFFAYQTVYGFIFNLDYNVNMGYSTLSFVGLYFLGQYIRKYPMSYTLLPKRKDILVYILLSLLLSVLSFVLIKYNIPGDGHSFLYSNPLIIISALYLFLFFKKMSFTSAVINFISPSVLAVYLFHSIPEFNIIVKKIIDMDYGLIERLLFLFVFAVLVFITAILIDLIRRYLWDIISRHVWPPKKETSTQ